MKLRRIVQDARCRLDGPGEPGGTAPARGRSKGGTVGQREPRRKRRSPGARAPGLL